jgi:hypothetical protein
VTWPITSSQLIHAVRLARWPARTLGGQCVRGESAWRTVSARMASAERAGVLRDLARRELLVAWPSGRGRLRAWLNRKWAGWRDAPRPLTYFGDLGMRPAVTRAIAQLPGPVRDFVLDGAYVLGNGYQLLGWTSLPLPADLRPLVIAGHIPERIEGIVHHEAAHAWVAPFDVGVRALPVAEYEAFLATARAEGWPLATDARCGAEEEDLVRLLVAGWGLA